MDMYQQMSPEMPGQMYAELVRTRAQQRLAQQTVTHRRTAPSRVPRTTKRLVASIASATRSKIMTPRHT
jgi:hypothetical protein